jgi:beta-lactamase class A
MAWMRVFRRLVVGVAVSVLVVPLAPVAAVAVGTFEDDDGDPGEVYIERLAELGAIEGCDPPTNERSCSDKELTRAEAFKILVFAGQGYDLLPSIPDGLADRFSDDDEMWDGAVSRLANFLADLLVVHGCNPPADTEVCPRESLTRAQVAKVVVETFRLTAPESYEPPWSDTEGKWYEQAARIGAYNGLWDTTSEHFDGGDEITRAEFARVVVMAGGEQLCPDEPFTAGRVSRLESRYPGQSFTAYAYDTRTGCAYWMNPEERLRTASVFKVLVMAGTLLEAQRDGRSLTSWERSQLEPMITESANSPVRALWRSFGGSPWFDRQVDRFGLDETNPVGDSQSVWGRATTSAKDQGDLIRQVLLGDWGPLQPEYREEAWDLMTSVVSSQTWGITAGVPDDWTVAQKNGFAGHIANSVGFVQEPGSDEGFVIAVLSNGWSDWERGIDAVEKIAGWVSAELAR